jgi:hypothetical protein
MQRIAARIATTGALLAAMLLVAMLGSQGQRAAAQTPAAAAPDFGRLGFPTVAGTATFTPGAATSVSGGGMTVNLAADFAKDPAKFELLTGSPSTFASAAGGRSVIAAWAFRVTDTTTNQLLSSFGSPAQWSYTNPAVTANSIVLNVTSATPPVVTPNGTPATISGQTIAHPFAGAGVGWLVANPAATAATGSAPSSVSAGTATGLAAPRAQAAAKSPAKGPVAAQGPVKGPIASQAPVKGPVTGQAPSSGPVVAQAPANFAPVAVAAAPRLPSTGTGGLLPQPDQHAGNAFTGAGFAALALATLAVGLRLRAVSRLL